jgi:hypothetical protein
MPWDKDLFCKFIDRKDIKVAVETVSSLPTSSTETEAVRNCFGATVVRIDNGDDLLEPKAYKTMVQD